MDIYYIINHYLSFVAFIAWSSVDAGRLMIVDTLLRIELRRFRLLKLSSVCLSSQWSHRSRCFHNHSLYGVSIPCRDMSKEVQYAWLYCNWQTLCAAEFLKYKHVGVDLLSANRSPLLHMGLSNSLHSFNSLTHPFLCILDDIWWCTSNHHFNIYNV